MVGIVLIGIALLGGYYLYSKKKSSSTMPIVPTSSGSTTITTGSGISQFNPTQHLPPYVGVVLDTGQKVLISGSSQPNVPRYSN